MQVALPRGLGPASRLGGRVRHLALGGEGAWARPVLLVVLVLTAVLYLWGLDRSGWANTYYAAAVLAGTQSWKAFFFGSFDAGSFITVDKPPAALWLMALSGRIFGFSSWSMLAPEALLGVGAVGLLYATVRRAAGPVAGLIAAAVMALTPVAVLMFRFNNPDALLTFLLVAAAWALMRAIENGRTRWLLLSAAVVGLAFLTKYLQAYIVLPAMVGTYLVLGPGGAGKRFVQLLGAAGALLVSSGWWVAVVSAIPAGSRPFVGGSTDDSVLNLVFGYDGFSRIVGALGAAGRSAGRAFGPGGGGGGGFGGGPGGGGPGGFGGQPGLLRLFNGEFGGEISWLLPLAAGALVLGIWATWRRPRPNVALAGFVLWGGWLLTHGLVFSEMSGIVHPYYAAVMAPALGGLIGPGVVEAWRLRGSSLWAGVIAAAALLVTAWWGNQLLSQTPDFLPWLGPLEYGLALLAAILLLAPRVNGLTRRLAAPALAIGLVAAMLGPSAYAIETARNPENGAIPTSGPARQAAGFGPGGGFTGGPRFGGFGGGGGFAPGGGGGTADAALVSYLRAHQGGATWLVAVGSANEGAPLELASKRPVLAMGGFSGGDPAMTVERMQQLVSSGQLRYVLVGGRGGFGGPQGPGGGPGGFGGVGPPGGGDAGGQSVTSWVASSCAQVAVPGAQVTGLYDCSGS